MALRALASRPNVESVLLSDQNGLLLDSQGAAVGTDSSALATSVVTKAATLPGVGSGAVVAIRTQGGASVNVKQTAEGGAVALYFSQ